MTTKTIVDDMDVSAWVSKVRFAKGMNSEPLPAAIECWGHKPCEDFSVYGSGNDVKVEPYTYWNNWNANGRGTFTQSADEKGVFVKDVALAWTTYPSCTFGTAQPASQVGTFVGIKWTTTSVVATGYYPFFLGGAPGSLVYLYHMGGKLYVRDYTGGANAWDELITPVVGVEYTIIIAFVVDTYHFDVYINGVLYDNAGAHFEKGNGRNAVVSYMGINSDASTIISFTLDDIWTSWADDWEHQLDSEVQVLIDDKYAWAGFITGIDQVDGPTQRYVLTCKDLFQRMEDLKCARSFLLASYTNHDTPTDNRLTLHETPDVNFIGKGAIISLNPVDNSYTADADSLKSSAAPDKSANIHEGGGDHEDTWTSEDPPVYHVTYIDGSQEDGTVDYTLQRASAAETPIKLELTVKGQLALSAGTWGKIVLYIYNTATPAWEELTTLAEIQTGLLVPSTQDFSRTIIVKKSAAGNYCHVNGANWEVHVQFALYNSVSSNRASLYLEKLRCEMTARDEAYEPISARIIKIDAGNKYVYVDAVPFVDSYLRDLDSVRVGEALSDLMTLAAGSVFDIVAIEDPHKWLAQDKRGSSWFDIFKLCTSLAGGYYYYQLDETTGDSTLYWISGTVTRKRFDDFYRDHEMNLDDEPEWVVTEGAGGGGFAYIDIDTNAFYLYLRGYTAAGPTDHSIHCVWTPGGTFSTLDEVELGVQLLIDYGSTTSPTIAFQFKTSGGTTRFKIEIDIDRKLTCMGTAGSGQINHALTASDYSRIKVMFTATTAKTYILDPGDDEYELLDTRTITSNDIATMEIEMGEADAPVDYLVSMFNTTFTINPTATSIDIQQAPKKSTRATTVRSVRVVGKYDTYEILVDSTSPREIVEVHDDYITPASVKARAQALALKYAANSRSIAVQPVNGNTNYQIGDFYEIVFNGETLTDLILRRAEFEYDAKERVPKWNLELDTGETSGHELIMKEHAGTRRAINDTRVANVADD